MEQFFACESCGKEFSVKWNYIRANEDDEYDDDGECPEYCPFCGSHIWTPEADDLDE